MNDMNVHPLTEARPTMVTRTLDVADRAHARAAMMLHNARNDLRTTLERGIERVEQLATTACQRARARVQRADHASADAVNRAQGAVGSAIERARQVRSRREHHAAV